jgi:hypothetical protein
MVDATKQAGALHHRLRYKFPSLYRKASGEALNLPVSLPNDAFIVYICNALYPSIYPLYYVSM